MFSNREDNDSSFALGVAFILIGIVVVTLIGTMVYKTSHKGVAQIAASTEPAVISVASAAAQATDSVASDVIASVITNVASEPASATIVTADTPSVVVVNGVVKFYFATGSAKLAAGADQALADVVKAVASGKKLVVSGYHDSTGNPASNEKLAKQRANSVLAALIKLGVAKTSLEMKKPESALADGPAAEARRVEVIVQ
jgi:outer membrane protein OmpA-like peptidoglycan-associated protein